MSNVYVYLLLDPRKPGQYPINEFFSLLYEPFYVGISSNKNRFKGHIGEAISSKNTSRKVNKIRKLFSLNLLPLEIKIFFELTKEQAVDFEKYFIKCIGRLDLKNGVLTNGTCGGDGSIGMVVTEEVKRKISKSLKGKKKGPQSDEHKRKNSEGHKGIKIHTEEFKTKMKTKMKHNTYGKANKGKTIIISNERREKLRNNFLINNPSKKIENRSKISKRMKHNSNAKGLRTEKYKQECRNRMLDRKRGKYNKGAIIND